MSKDWIRGQPQIADAEDLAAEWGFKKNNFKCKMCGHKFKIGEYWRFVFANSTPNQRTGNFLVCKSCDGDDVLKRAGEQYKIACRWFSD